MLQLEKTKAMRTLRISVFLAAAVVMTAVVLSLAAFSPISATASGDDRALQWDGFWSVQLPIGPDSIYISPAGGGSQGVHIVRIPTEHPFVHLRTALGRERVVGLEPVLAQALRHHRPEDAPDEVVIAAINGDFFGTSTLSGMPVGVHIQGGEIVTDPAERPAFGVGANGRPVIGVPTLLGFVWGPGAKAPAQMSVKEALVAAAAGTDPDATVAIDAVNRNGRVGVTLYTARFGPQTPPVHGTVITVRGVLSPGRPGVMHTGLVADVMTYTVQSPQRVNIPRDGAVFVAAGEQPTMLHQLAIGDWVYFAFEFAPPFAGVTDAVAGWPVLIKDGIPQPLSTSDPLVTGRHPRTAVGFNDEEIFIVAVDGRRPGYAEGMTLFELTNLLLSLGVTDAINLDGGGSTTLVVRRPGNVSPVLANVPSDGTERSVANSLLVIGTAPTMKLSRLHVQPAAPALLRNALMPITVTGLDKYNNPLPVSVEDIHWRWDAFNLDDGRPTSGAGAVWAVPSEGGPTTKIGAQFMFTSTSPGRHKARLTATLGDISGTAEVDVVDEVTALHPNVAHLNVASGDTAVLSVNAYDGDGRQIWLEPHQLEWTIEPQRSSAEGHDGRSPIVAVNSVGHVTGLSAGEATVYARHGPTIAPIRVFVDEPPAVIADLSEVDTIGLWQARGVRAVANLRPATPPEPLRVGRASLHFVYDLSVNSGATAAAYVEAVDPVAISGRPEAIGVWVYATHNGHWLRGNIIDGNGARHVIDFTDVGGLNWAGWRFVTALVPDDVTLPIYLERIYVAEFQRERQGPGELFFDRIVALYNGTEAVSP